MSEIRSLRIFMEQTVQGSVRSWSAISIQKEEIQIVLKRKLEKIVLFFLQKISETNKVREDEGK